MSVNLRTRKQSKGSIKYFLDINHNGKMYYDFLDIKIFPTDTKQIKTDKKNLAELMRSNREIELIIETTSYVPKHLKEVNFFYFCNVFIKDWSLNNSHIFLNVKPKRQHIF